jgi:hypothetical protein
MTLRWIMDKCRLMNWKQFVYKEKEEEKKNVDERSSMNKEAIEY